MIELLRRLPIVLLGYGVAVLSAPVFALALSELTTLVTGNGESLAGPAAGTFLFIGIQLTGIYAALPFMAAVALMRLLGLRHWAIHSFSGAAVAYAALALLLGGPPTGDELNPTFLLAGAGAGVVYWAVRRLAGWL